LTDKKERKPAPKTKHIRCNARRWPWRWRRRRQRKPMRQKKFNPHFQLWIVAGVSPPVKPASFDCNRKKDWTSRKLLQTEQNSGDKKFKGNTDEDWMDASSSSRSLQADGGVRWGYVNHITTLQKKLVLSDWNWRKKVILKLNYRLLLAKKHENNKLNILGWK